MPHDPHRHQRRKRIARLYLCGVFLLILAADALLLRFAFSDSNPFPLLKGVLFGQVLAATVLVGGVWRRRAWSRYVLMGLLGLTVAIMGLVLLIIGTRPDLTGPYTYQLLCGGIALIVAADVWLILSKRLQYLVAVAGSGG